MNLDIIDIITNDYLDLDLNNIIKYMLTSKIIYKHIIKNKNLWNSICYRYFNKSTGVYTNYIKLLKLKTIYLKPIKIYNNIKYNVKYHTIKKNKIIKIGRSRKNNICVLHDPHISRFHAEIIFINTTKIFIKDLKSSNNIYINSNKIKSNININIYNNDIINFGGDSTFQIIFKK
jgi:pSer/pThr/pTyr-binding forkhead associated (FHA) protein